MKRKVLVADDQLYIHRLIQHRLEEEEYQIVTARDGCEVIEITAREAPDLVVMDVMMPRMDGLTALRHLKRNPATRAIPVIVLTSSPHELVREEAEFSGADLVLSKPFSPTGLLEAVRRLVSASSARAGTSVAA
ncbi:MAG TPA: response regulator [Verrucomicrobiae bacterium]|nr:response regulator [Verrucomicrobiae bacterium]